MAQIGQFALALAFVVTVYSIAASLIGIRVKHDKLIPAAAMRLWAHLYASQQPFYAWFICSS